MDRPEFEKVARRLMDHYFGHPSCYRIDGKPVLCIYELGSLISGLDGIKETAQAIA